MLSGDYTNPEDNPYPGVIDIVAQVANQGYPVIFMGDMNNHYEPIKSEAEPYPDDEQDPERKQYDQLKRLEEELGFKVDSHKGNTYNDWGNKPYTDNSADENYRVNIDYVFYKNLTEESSEVMTNKNQSDHWPVKVEFTLP